MTSKADRKRRKKTITLPGGGEVKMRIGKGHRTDLDDNGTTALSHRARMLGKPDTPEGRKAVSGPEYGCAVGRAIMASQDTPEQKADLWQAVKHIRTVWVAYDRAIGAPSRHAKCLSILAPAPAMSADAASPALDIRSQDDRDRQAVASYMTLCGWLGHVDGIAQSSVIGAVVDEPDHDGYDFAAIKRALLCVADGIRGRKLVWRGV
jgi:hypothetical protein